MTDFTEEKIKEFKEKFDTEIVKYNRDSPVIQFLVQVILKTEKKYKERFDKYFKKEPFYGLRKDEVESFICKEIKRAKKEILERVKNKVFELNQGEDSKLFYGLLDYFGIIVQA